MNAAVHVYEGFERNKEEIIVIVLDLEDAYNRVQYDLLMRTQARLDVSLFLVMWRSCSPGKKSKAGSGAERLKLRTLRLDSPKAQLSSLCFSMFTPWESLAISSKVLAEL